MAFGYPSDTSVILYGNSGDVRSEINAYAAASTAGHYADENEVPGLLIINSLRRSTRMINAYLEPVYASQIPFAASGDVPVFLDEISTDIATYYTLRSVTAKLGSVSEEKKAAYFDHYTESPDGLLVQIRDRRLQLSELTAVSPDQAKSVRARGRHPVFDLDDAANYEPDSDLLRDISDERGT